MDVFTKTDKQRVEGEDDIRWRRNERIVDILERKPQHVFENFLVALCETRQEHVANIVRGLEVDAVVQPETTNSTSIDEATEQSVREVIKEDQLNRQHDNNNTIMKTLDGIGVQITDVCEGSIKVKFSLTTQTSLEQLKILVSSRELDRLFIERYCPQFADADLKSLRIEITAEEFERCDKEMAKLALMTPSHKATLEHAKEEIAVNIEVAKDLLKRLSLCGYRKQSILGGKDKGQVLMDVVAKRPDFEFQEFLGALKNTGQNECVAFLTGVFHTTTKTTTTSIIYYAYRNVSLLNSD